MYADVSATGYGGFTVEHSCHIAHGLRICRGRGSPELHMEGVAWYWGPWPTCYKMKELGGSLITKMLSGLLRQIAGTPSTERSHRVIPWL